MMYSDSEFTSVKYHCLVDFERSIGWLTEMSSPLMPEFFALLGIDVFLGISLLTCLLDKHFPGATSYIYQAAALAGFGHLLVSREFMSIFGDYMRFWYCLIYLVVALANVVVVNIYLATPKKLWKLAKIFFGAVTFPTILVSTFFVYGYANGTMMSLPLFPQIPMGFLYVALVVYTIVLGGGIFVSLKTTKSQKNVQKEVK